MKLAIKFIFNILYPIWIIKRFLLIKKNSFVVQNINANLRLILENKCNRFNGGAKTEDDHIEIFKKTIFNATKNIILIYGFNSLIFYFFKIKSNKDCVIIYYTHDLYFKRIEGVFFRKFHEFLHYKLISSNVQVILHCNPFEVDELRQSTNCKVYWINARIIKKKIVYKKIEYDNLNLLLVGSQEHRLNVTHTIGFIKDIFPHLRRNFRGIKLNIVGMHATLFSNLVQDDIIFHGAIDDEDLNFLMNNCSIGISPIPIYSGVNIKCLDYLFNGLCVICHESAKYSLEGSGSNILLRYANNKDQWIGQINNLIHEDSNLNLQKTHLEQMYSEQNFENIFQSVLDEIDESK